MPWEQHASVDYCCSHSKSFKWFKQRGQHKFSSATAKYSNRHFVQRATCVVDEPTSNSKNNNNNNHTTRATSSSMIGWWVVWWVVWCVIMRPMQFVYIFAITQSGSEREWILWEMHSGVWMGRYLSSPIVCVSVSLSQLTYCVGVLVCLHFFFLWGTEKRELIKETKEKCVKNLLLEAIGIGFVQRNLNWVLF